MRVLVANKFWYRRGGLERVMFDEIAWLSQAGHEVAHFSTAHPENDPSPWSDYFVPYLELGESGGLSPRMRALAAARMIYNGEAARRFELLLDAFRPDVVHIHGIHRQISPSILSVARHQGTPVVQTLHDYHHLCPADLLLYAGREVCEPRRCGTLWYGPAVFGLCVRGSLSASGLSAAETTWSRASRSYERGVRRFISPSRFMAGRMRQGGWETPTDIVPNAAPLGTPRADPGSGFALIGRVVREKGMIEALEAAREAGVSLTVAGEGPLLVELRSRYPGVAFTGRLDGPEVGELVHRSRGVVVPSLVFENAPMAVLEALGSGVPVIASALGGIPELITDGVEGFLVRPGDVGALSQAMATLAADAAMAMRMGASARAKAETEFTSELHLEGLLESYRAAMADEGGAA